MHSKVVNPSDFKLCFGNVGLNDPKPLGREASVNWCIRCSYWLLVQFPLVPMYMYSYAAHSWCSCTCYCL